MIGVRLSFAFTLLALLAPLSSLGFNDWGHMLTAGIVRQTKNKDLQKFIETVETLNELLLGIGVIPTHDETNFGASFEHMAIFGDYLSHRVPRLGPEDEERRREIIMRPYSDPRFNLQHFKSIEHPEAIREDGTNRPVVDHVDGKGNIFGLIEAFDLTLRLQTDPFFNRVIDPNAYLTPSTLYHQLSFWMHLMGDIANPMHFGNLKSGEGNIDFGGAKIKIVPAEGSKGEKFRTFQKKCIFADGYYPLDHLHHLWDSMAWSENLCDKNGYYEKYANRQYLREEIQRDVEYIMGEHPKEQFTQLSDEDEQEPSKMYGKMGAESLRLYQDEVMPSLVQNNVWIGEGGDTFVVDDAYLKLVHKHSIKRVALAGYRMEARLIKLLKQFQQTNNRSGKTENLGGLAKVASSLLQYQQQKLATLMSDSPDFMEGPASRDNIKRAKGPLKKTARKKHKLGKKQKQRKARVDHH